MLSAAVRSTIYLTAMIRSTANGKVAVVLVEIAYVALTAGVYAGMQQKALQLRSRVTGNLIVVVGVPGLAQVLDWTAHRVTGAPAGNRATVAVSVFALISALFHLHVMRNGAFLTGQGRSLADDFRRMPRLVAGFVVKPASFLAGVFERSVRAIKSEPAV